MKYLTLFAVFIVGISGSLFGKNKSIQPNIVMIFTDDMGFDNLSPQLLIRVE